ncbi:MULTISPECIES: DsbA family oxidoreductase [unclassified Microbispora]|uniref:DsbA family oxidoreductase n=1 Tax=unclassified Microbispora TaxID=2614687 RepID=UPI0015FED21A|nr:MULTISPECIES: DsbA family oxidoreductase [unclassified Microbispora]GLX03640.1 DSBA oxidoreductase [Microbispora sp. NBRC 16548]
MKVEIFSDVVCPWCYIGHHRLREAVRLYEGDVEVAHRPFQLDPDGVSGGEPLLRALERKFGGAARVAQMTGHVTGVAAQDGLELHFDRAVAANTFEAHRLIRLAGRAGRDADMADRLFRAHFTDGLDVGDPATLAALAAEAGVEDTGEGADEVRAELARARALGVRAVPLFLFEEKFAVSGAQPVETLVAALREVEARTAEERAVRVPAGEDCDDGTCAV